MIEKWYEVTCDYCGCVINHFIGRRPTDDEIKEIGGYTTPTKQFCDYQCFSNWYHDKQEKKYLNLRQKGRIHTND